MSDVSSLPLNYSSRYLSSVTSLWSLYTKESWDHTFSNQFLQLQLSSQNTKSQPAVLDAFWHSESHFIVCNTIGQSVIETPEKKVRFSNGVTPQASRERAGRGIQLTTTELILSQKWVFLVPLWMSHTMNSHRSDQNWSQVNICHSLFGDGWYCSGPKFAQNLCSSWQSPCSALHEF